MSNDKLKSETDVTCIKFIAFVPTPRSYVFLYSEVVLTFVYTKLKFLEIVSFISFSKVASSRKARRLGGCRGIRMWRIIPILSIGATG
jgi:hypothetical protein